MSSEKFPKQDRLHSDFAERFSIACGNNPNIPELNQGRLQWIKEQMEEHYDRTISLEAIRRWMHGMSFPRPKAMEQLVKILDCDHAWLATGRGDNIPIRHKRIQSLAASGLVNLFAGMVQLAGWTISFSEPDHEKQTDFVAIIKGGVFNIHVIMVGSDGGIKVPQRAVNNILVVAMPSSRLTYRFFKLESEDVKAIGAKWNSYYVVPASFEMSEIMSLADGI